ncbi:hypothetical protein C0992_009259, partial [Termitomyces sp. T32_za158]
EIGDIKRYFAWYHNLVSAVNEEAQGDGGVSASSNGGHRTHEPWTIAARPAEARLSKPEPTTCLELQQLRRYYKEAKSRENMYYIL